jgi:O-antigen/teichoic acid export membrane protein
VAPASSLNAPKVGAGSIRKPVLRTLLTNVSVLFLGLGTSVILNRGLGPVGKGLYATLLTTSQLILMLASLGLGKSVTFYLSNEEEKPQSVFKVFLALSFGAAVLSLCIALIVGVFCKHGDIYKGACIYYLAILSLLSVLHSSGVGVLRGLKQFAACNGQSLITAAIFGFAAAILAAGGKLNPILAICCKAFSFLAGVALIWPKLKTLGFQFRPELESAIAGKMLRYGLGYFFYALFQNLSYRFDLILVAHLTSLADAGWYSTASGLAEIVWYFPNAVGLVLFPIIAGMSNERRDQLVCKTCRWSILIMTLGVAGLVIVAPVLIRLLYGERFLPTVSAIYSLSFGIITNGMFQILGVHLAAKQRLGTLTLITASGFAINLVFNSILIPRLGIIGAGLSSTISYSLCGFLTAWAFIKMTGRKPAELFLISRDELVAVGRSLVQKLRVRFVCAA